MKKIRLMLMTLLLVSQGAWGESASILDGNQLQEFCKATNDFKNKIKASACLFYVSGVNDTHDMLTTYPNNLETNMEPLWCMPLRQTNLQMAEKVLAYLEANPDMLDLSASSLVSLTFVRSYPCN